MYGQQNIKIKDASSSLYCIILCLSYIHSSVSQIL